MVPSVFTVPQQQSQIINGSSCCSCRRHWLDNEKKQDYAVLITCLLKLCNEYTIAYTGYNNLIHTMKIN